MAYESNGMESFLEDDFERPVDDEVQDELTPRVISQSPITEDEPVIKTESADNEEPEEASDENAEQTENPYENNALYGYLYDRGIDDPSHLKFEDEDGNIVEKDFEELSVDEQKMILAQVSTPNISDQEYADLNYLRHYNMSLEQMMRAYAAQQIEEYKKNAESAQSTSTYSIDDFNDDELYLADLQSKYKSLSNEELLAELDYAKENEEAYNKKVQDLRTQYKELEDRERAAAKEREQREYEDLRNTITNAVSSLNEFALDYADPASDSLVVEEQDKKEMLAYIFDQDATGKSQLAKDLENPDTLAELALLRTKGAEFLASTTRYYKEELAKAHKEKKRLENQLSKYMNKPSSVVVEHATKESTPKFGNRTAYSANYFDKLI